MISCTDFILSYSELFQFLAENYGREEVDRYWEAIFKPNGKNNPLILFVEKEGIRGCFTYWSGTLNEEAADFTLYLNEKAGWFQLVMHKCPSKGRLLHYADKIGIRPFPDYCLHCDHYRAAIEKVGLNYTYNFIGMEKAACSILITDPKVFNGRLIVDENTQVMDRRASDNEYFHLDFHRGPNQGVEFLGSRHGTQAVVDYLTQFTKNAYKPVMEAAAREGLAPIEAKIVDTYQKEKAEDALTITHKDGEMRVKIDYCPAVAYMNQKQIRISQWYPYTTTTVMEVLAQAAGYQFEMVHYQPETGAAEYRFFK